MALNENTEFLNEILALANSLPGAGGGGGASANFEIGSFTVSQQTACDSYDIQHSLGHAPSIVVFWLTARPTGNFVNGMLYGGIFMPEESAWRYYAGGGTGSCQTGSSDGISITTSHYDSSRVQQISSLWTSTKFTIPGGSSSNTFCQGIQYKWLAAYWD